MLGSSLDLFCMYIALVVSFYIVLYYAVNNNKLGRDPRNTDIHGLISKCNTLTAINQSDLTFYQLQWEQCTTVASHGFSDRTLANLKYL